MNWKIIVGGILIFAGIAQFLKIFNDYRHTTTMSVSVGLGFLFVGVIIVGIFLVRQGRKEI
jgi:multisubunit Na+/H+ antiporter MnhG subunit